MRTCKEHFQAESHEETLEALQGHGAIQRGHFKLSSGKHSGVYVQCARLIQHVGPTLRVAERLWRMYRQYTIERQGDPLGVNVLVGPAIGAVSLTWAISSASRLTGGIRRRAMWAEKTPSGFELRRGFEINPRDGVIVVEDVLTTGGSAAKIIDLVRSKKGRVRGVFCIVQRQPDLDLGVPIFAMVREDMPMWEPEDCPLCKQGVPLTRPGS